LTDLNPNYPASIGLLTAAQPVAGERNSSEEMDIEDIELNVKDASQPLRPKHTVKPVII
jgi:hypothetical protein